MAGNTFTYDFDNYPLIAYVRLLIPDTNSETFIYSDEEITAFYSIQGSVFQSAQFYSGSQGRNTPSSPVSYVRVAALALDSLANNTGRLAGVLQILDVKLDLSKAAEVLRQGAKNYREVDDDAGAFMIIEQTNTDWSFRDRVWKQFERQQLGSGWSG